MSRRKSRHRHLGKLAARRAAERRRKRRQRIIAAGVALGVALAGSVLVFVAFTGGKGRPRKAAAATASPTPAFVPCSTAKPKAASVKKPTFSARPPMTIDPKKIYTATVKTSCGTYVLQLDAAQTPVTVNSFVFLAEKGFYDGLTFHRIAPGFVIQGGDPKGDGTGGPGYQFKNEIVTGLNFDAVGMLGMANSGPNTNGSQWFITLAPSPSLDGKYTVFGKVIKGLDVVQNIGRVPVTIPPGAPAGAAPETPKRTIYIDKVTITAGA